MSTRTRDETHEECHAESIHKDEDKFEVKSGLRGESRHPIGTALRVSSLFRVLVVGEDTYMVETIMAGIIRRGITSNMKQESNQAVGLKEQRSVTTNHVLVSAHTYRIYWIFHGGTAAGFYSALNDRKAMRVPC
jgi:hypothetical protein